MTMAYQYKSYESYNIIIMISITCHEQTIGEKITGASLIWLCPLVLEMIDINNKV